MDLGSFRVGQPTAEGGFFNYAIKWLAKKAKMKLSRAKRVMSDLNNAMIISSYQYRELIDEETEQYRAYNAARVFDIEFFKMLEVDEQKLGEARKIAGRKQKYIHKAYKEEQSKKEQAVARLQMKKMMKMLDPNDPAFNFNHKPKVAEEIEANKRLNEQRLAVINELMQNPYYQNNDAELRLAVKARLEAEGLLMDKEKASLQ
jgi:hypothetical protein